MEITMAISPAIILLLGDARYSGNIVLYEVIC